MSESTSGRGLREFSRELAELVARAGRHVVTVNGRPRLPGSGIVWTEDGLIVTSDHALEIEEGLTVSLPDGRQVEAALVGRDAGTDVALLRVQAEGLEPAPRAEGLPEVGSLVLAVTRPGGRGLTASAGVVSGRLQPWRSWRGASPENLIQTDVTLYPGFSGSPLVDAEGQVTGMNTSILTRGSGAAVPVATVEGVVQALLAHGRVRAGYLGIGTRPVPLPRALATSLGLSQGRGLLVVGVEAGSPAERGGILFGDVLLALDGQPVVDGEDLRSLLGPDSIGREARVELIRAGERREVTVTVGERP
jgi:serine protease Do